LARALARAAQILPPDDAAAFTAVMQRDASKYLPAARQLKEARARLDSEITADNFNQAEVRQTMAQAQAAWNTFADKISGSMIEALAGVSPEGRRKLVAQRQAERVEP
jgi:Spy/CpxP family protein refolding chaperone